MSLLLILSFAYAGGFYGLCLSYHQYPHVKSHKNAIDHELYEATFWIYDLPSVILDTSLTTEIQPFTMVSQQLQAREHTMTIDTLAIMILLTRSF
ncbi:unnamed protein product [Absidia cylindrospora]